MRQVIEDINKLPRWARNKIEVLENEVRYHRAIAEAICGKETLIKVGHEHHLFLPNDSTITFKMLKGDIRVSIRGGNLYINSNEMILIKPEASNSASIDIERR